MKVLSKLSLGKQVAISGVVGILILALILGYSSYQSTKSNLLKVAAQKLTVIREAKKQHIDDYFEYVGGLLLSEAKNSSTVDALREFETGFYLLSKEVPVDISLVRKALLEEYRKNYLPRIDTSIPGTEPIKDASFYLPRDPNGLIAQYIFIVKNPYPVGKKNLFLKSDEFNCTYMKAHARYHKDFNSLLKNFGLYDIFLIDRNGTIVYTAFKEKDFATNLLTGPYRNTGLAKVFREAVNSKKDAVFFSDFAPYEPSYNQPAAFIATPVIDNNGKLLGVLAFQLPIDKIDSIVNFNYRFKEVGLGKTGEVLLVGSDFKLKNNVRFLNEIDNPIVKRAKTTIGILELKDKAVQLALSGKSGVTETTDLLGKKALAAYGPIDVYGKRWAIIAEMEEGEIMADLLSLRKNRALLISIASLFVLVTLFLLFVRFNIVKPLKSFVEMTRELSEGEGDLTKRLKFDPEKGDEINLASKYFNAFLDKVREIVARARHSAESNLKIAEELRTDSELLREKIRTEMNDIAKASELALNVSEPVKEFEELLSKSQKDVAKALEGVESARSSIEKLKEIVETTSKENEVSIGELQELNKKAQDIENIIGIIRNIAERTNLLALNAAIEAARAGETGKGFAVVADEIRKLAAQIQKNTESISEILTNIVNAISEVTENISARNRENDQYLREVSSSVIEEMEKVSKAMDETAEVQRTIVTTSSQIIADLEELISLIQDMDKHSKENVEVIEKTLEKIREIYREASDLYRILNRFKV